ncbi:MAG: hypothetical protein CMF38_01300 [Legionellaceae bacterium]|nr:hypothetical protein [Legionellaceae bacterium]HAF88143.1 hypothetical protein [Legionellales bacterium]HCA88836.1 hypothetical protein [Legionellales bacterium]|tara:strand:- start:124 stop:738 length:615 start_codon:yes stop_codon:yes gene_type:complete
MINDTHIANSPNLTPLKRISWSAIFIGAFIGLGLSFLLNLFSVAIGLTVFTQTDTNANVLAWGGYIAFLIGIIVAMLAAGYAAGYLGRLYCPKRNLGIVYGFTTWTVSLIFMVIMAAQLSSYVMSYGQFMGYDTVRAPMKGYQVTIETNQTASTNIAQATQKNSSTTVAHAMAWSVFMMFLSFMIGAIMCCIGACWAMTCHQMD